MRVSIWGLIVALAGMFVWCAWDVQQPNAGPGDIAREILIFSASCCFYVLLACREIIHEVRKARTEIDLRITAYLDAVKWEERKR